MTGPYIVLVEDNRADAYLVEEALREHVQDFTLHVIADGEEAYEFFTHTNTEHASVPNLIVLDLNLPKIAGTALLELLRSQRRTAETPIAVLTSSDSPQDRDYCHKLGATIYLKKPSDLSEFLDLGRILRQVLAGPGRASA